MARPRSSPGVQCPCSTLEGPYARGQYFSAEGACGGRPRGLMTEPAEEWQARAHASRPWSATSAGSQQDTESGGGRLRVWGSGQQTDARHAQLCCRCTCTRARCGTGAVPSRPQSQPATQPTHTYSRGLYAGDHLSGDEEPTGRPSAQWSAEDRNELLPPTALSEHYPQADGCWCSQLWCGDHRDVYPTCPRVNRHRASEDEGERRRTCCSCGDTPTWELTRNIDYAPFTSLPHWDSGGRSSLREDVEEGYNMAWNHACRPYERHENEDVYSVTQNRRYFRDAGICATNTEEESVSRPLGCTCSGRWCNRAHYGPNYQEYEAHSLGRDHENFSVRRSSQSCETRSENSFARRDAAHNTRSNSFVSVSDVTPMPSTYLAGRESELILPSASQQSAASEASHENNLLLAPPVNFRAGSIVNIDSQRCSAPSALRSVAIREESTRSNASCSLENVTPQASTDGFVRQRNILQGQQVSLDTSERTYHLNVGKRVAVSHLEYLERRNLRHSRPNRLGIIPESTTVEEFETATSDDNKNGSKPKQKILSISHPEIVTIKSVASKTSSYFAQNSEELSNISHKIPPPISSYELNLITPGESNTVSNVKTDDNGFRPEENATSENRLSKDSFEDLQNEIVHGNSLQICNKKLNTVGMKVNTTVSTESSRLLAASKFPEIVNAAWKIIELSGAYNGDIKDIKKTSHLPDEKRISQSVNVSENHEVAAGLKPSLNQRIECFKELEHTPLNVGESGKQDTASGENPKERQDILSLKQSPNSEAARSCNDTFHYYSSNTQLTTLHTLETPNSPKDPLRSEKSSTSVKLHDTSSGNLPAHTLISNVSFDEGESTLENVEKSEKYKVQDVQNKITISRNPSLSGEIALLSVSESSETFLNTGKISRKTNELSELLNLEGKPLEVYFPNTRLTCGDKCNDKHNKALSYPGNTDLNRNHEVGTSLSKCSETHLKYAEKEIFHNIKLSNNSSTLLHTDNCLGIGCSPELIRQNLNRKVERKKVSFCLTSKSGGCEESQRKPLAGYHSGKNLGHFLTIHKRIPAPHPLQRVSIRSSPHRKSLMKEELAGGGLKEESSVGARIRGLTSSTQTNKDSDTERCGLGHSQDCLLSAGDAVRLELKKTPEIMNDIPEMQGDVFFTKKSSSAENKKSSQKWENVMVQTEDKDVRMHQLNKCCQVDLAVVRNLSKMFMNVAG